MRDDQQLVAEAAAGSTAAAEELFSRHWLPAWARCSPPEIAEILDLPVGRVHSRLARALADLRSRLEVAT